MNPVVDTTPSNRCVCIIFFCLKNKDDSENNKTTAKYFAPTLPSKIPNVQPEKAPKQPTIGPESGVYRLLCTKLINNSTAETLKLRWSSLMSENRNDDLV